MSDPSPSSPPSTEGARQAIAARMQGVLDRPVATLNAVQAVQHIRACVAFSRAIFSAVEAQIMEAAWIVRRGHPERADFERFVLEQGVDDAMSPHRAWRYAETWDVIRRQRSLRELAHDRPHEAMSLVCEYRDAGGETDALDDDDRHVQYVLSQPKRRRVELLREMARARRASNEGRSPADVEQIRTLTEERDAAVRELAHKGGVVPMADTPPGRVQSLYGELADIHTRMADIAVRYEAALEGQPRSGAEPRPLAAAVSNMTGLADRLIEQAERITAASFGLEPETD